MPYPVLILLGAAVAVGAFACPVRMGKEDTAKAALAELGIVLSAHVLGMLVMAIGLVGALGPFPVWLLLACYYAAALVVIACHHFATRHRTPR